VVVTALERVADLVLAVFALVMAVVSIILGDADKSPVYFLLAYALWRLSRRSGLSPRRG
jgi:hypothetical protein